MRRHGWFGFAAFAAGVLAQALLSYFWRTPAPAPQVLLLAVLAVGALGKTNTAQTLGFLWGLMLDVQGVSLFGCQGWILAATGFLAGQFSRQLDGEKLSAQALLAAAGTFLHLAAFAEIEALFRRGTPPHATGLGVAALQLLMNLAAAPVVFRAVQALARFAPSSEGDHVFRV